MENVVGTESLPAASRHVRLALMLTAVAGLAAAALGDEDDKKLQDRKPAVLGSTWRNPDPWKLLSRQGPVSNNGDATFPSRNINLLTWMPVNTFPGFSTAINNQSGADCWGYTSPSGREYALIGLGWGIGVVEVTNPQAPVIMTLIPGTDSLWHDVTIVGNYAYAVTDQSGVGIQIINLTNIDAGQVSLVRNYSQGGHTTTHTILSNPQSGYLYLCGGNAANGGMIPAATTPDPTFPTFAGLGWRTRYVHEAFITTYEEGPYAGREFAFLFTGGSSTGSISIVDVTDKNALVNMSTIVYPGRNYSHQGWLSPDKKYLYHNDEIDGPTQSVPRMLTRVFDVSDLAMPRLITAFTNGLPSVDHNEYFVGRYLFQSNYTTGLRVWDMYDPLKPVEVAFLDTRPENDGTGYNGAWGNYPYFNSGTILVSDIERGLFIAKLSLLEFTPIQASPLPTTLVPGQSTPLSITLAEKSLTFEAAELRVSVNGSGFTTYPMQRQGDTLSGSLPPAACGDRIRYYIYARATNQAEFTWPLSAPTETVSASAYATQTTIFTDNFQSSLGWSVQNTGTVAGAWARAVPITNGGPGAVIGDADGSGSCYVTGNTLNADVDGGPTMLLSPTFDLTAYPEARVSYSRWLLSLVAVTDNLITEVSNNDGASWTPVQSFGPTTGGWRTHTFRVADYVTPTSQVRVRFSIGDADTSTTEAGIDAFRVFTPDCAPVTNCYANCDGSTVAPVLNVADFTCFLQRFAAGESYANCDNSTAAPILNVADFTCFLQSFAAGCQ
jgi:choice-of-anchor B domain-containing protein